MTGILTRLGARLDTWGGAAKMARFRTGWAATATPQVRFHRVETRNAGLNTCRRAMPVETGVPVVVQQQSPAAVEHQIAAMRSKGPVIVGHVQIKHDRTVHFKLVCLDVFLQRLCGGRGWLLHPGVTPHHLDQDTIFSADTMGQYGRHV